MHKIKDIFYKLYGPAIISAILLSLSFPKTGLYYLAWFALVPLLVFLYGKSRKESFKIGITFGVIFFFLNLYWIYYAISNFSSVPFVLSLVIVFLLALYLSIYPAMFSILYSIIIKNSNLPALFIAPMLWTCLEFLRSYALTGFPWASLGYSQYNFLYLIQIADVTGIYGISFLVCAFNGAISDIILIKRRVSERPLYSLIPTISGFIILSVLFLGIFLYGHFRINEQREGNNVRAAIIQGNIEQDKKWDAVFQDQVISIYKELSMNASKFNPDIIVWPETAIPFYFGRDLNRTKDLLEFQKGLNSYLLFGSVLIREYEVDKKSIAPRTEHGYTNSAILLNKDGNLFYTYDKIHLVPFGEYVPLKKILFFIDKLVVGVGDFIPGNNYIKADTPFGGFGTLICYEIIFPGLVRKFYTNSGDFIITITNDAWFGWTDGPYQHFSMAVFRAVENRKPVIRAANTGISGFIDSNGKILNTTGLFERDFLVKDVKSDRTKTFYTKYGDIFSYLCIVFTIILLVTRIELLLGGR